MEPRGKSESTRAGGAEQSVDTEETLYDVLHHLGEALAIVETVARALHAAENDGEAGTTGPAIVTLYQAVEALRAVHEELDLAIGGSNDEQV
jgi:hypothetical protein